MCNISEAVIVFEDARENYLPGELVVVRVGGKVLDKGRLVMHLLTFEGKGETVTPFNGIVLSDILSKEWRTHTLVEGMEFEFGNLKK